MILLLNKIHLVQLLVYHFLADFDLLDQVNRSLAFWGELSFLGLTGQTSRFLHLIEIDVLEVDCVLVAALEGAMSALTVPTLYYHLFDFLVFQYLQLRLRS